MHLNVLCYINMIYPNIKRDTVSYATLNDIK